MDNRPIGFFDSGLGGLTCVSPLLKLLPKERVIYFGDTARTPYGSKDPATIRRFAAEISGFLLSQNVKMIVIACNTVSAVALEDLRRRFPGLPILGIITPAASEVARMKDRRIGIIGTKVTVKSRAYETAIGALNGDLPLYSVACPAFVPLIEEGIVDDAIMDLTIRHYLDGFLSEKQIDTLVLGCTHYPLIRENIKRLYPDLAVVDPAESMAESIRAELTAGDMLAEAPERENLFYASDLSENFINMINTISQMSQFQLGFKNFDLEVRPND